MVSKLTYRRFFRHVGLTEEEMAEAIQGKSPVLNKTRSVRDYILYMLNRTSEMFVYKGLPPTIPKVVLENLLQTVGFVIVANAPKGSHPVAYGIDFNYDELPRGHSDGELGPFAFYGSFGQAPDPYQAPYMAVVANPGFVPTISKEYKINEECIIFRNDMQMLSMMPLFKRYAWELSEAAISLRSALINLRENRVIVAANDRAYQSAEAYLEKLEAGDLAAITDTPVLGDSKVFGSEGRANAVIQAIEAVQYLKSSWFNEVGLQSSFNMKREYLSKEEVAANTDVLMPLVDDMFECRKRGCAAMNAMFGLNVSVEKNSAWYNKEQETSNYLMEDDEEQEGGEEEDGHVATDE